MESGQRNWDRSWSPYSTLATCGPTSPGSFQMSLKSHQCLARVWIVGWPGEFHQLWWRGHHPGWVPRWRLAWYDTTGDNITKKVAISNAKPHSVKSTMYLVLCALHIVFCTIYRGSCKMHRFQGVVKLMRATIKIVYIGGQFGLIPLSPLMYYFTFMQATR